jgi:predicted ABC-type ATPase
MPKIKRLRVFAGPNGSGKSTLFDTIASKFYVGDFINSDLIENEIATKGFINLDRFGLVLSAEDLENFKKDEAIVSLLEKAHKQNKEIDVILKNNVIIDKSKSTHSYEAAFITSFIRKHLVEKGISYSFETVMSHISKLDELKLAKSKGYKTYLYFVCIEDPEINISRIENRVQKGGHPVPRDKVISRYHQTLANLLPALKLVDKAYIFDNSSKSMKLFAEVISGELNILDDKIPVWFYKNVVE